MKSITNILLLASTTAVASAYVIPPSQSVVSRSSTQLSESFGFKFAEDTYENQPDFLKGEQEYKNYVDVIQEDNFVNRRYNVLRRVRELDLLKKTVDGEVLTSLEELGLDLKTVEELLPVAEELGLLSLVGKNQQLLVNLVAPVVVEGAPFLLPLVASGLKQGPSAFYAAAAAVAALEGALIVSNAEVPFVGLSAAWTLGLLLVPTAGALGVAGSALGSLKK